MFCGSSCRFLSPGYRVIYAPGDGRSSPHSQHSLIKRIKLLPDSLYSVFVSLFVGPNKKEFKVSPQTSFSRRTNQSQTQRIFKGFKFIVTNLLKAHFSWRRIVFYECSRTELSPCHDGYHKL